MSVALVDRTKVSSANSLYVDLRSTAHHYVFLEPKTPEVIRNILNDFLKNFLSPRDIKDKKDLDIAHYISYHGKDDAVLYPFQPFHVVEVGFFLETVAKWKVILNVLSQLAEFFKDSDLAEFVETAEETFDEFTDF